MRLSGEVRYDGQPMEVGRIRFIPLPGTEAPLTIIDFKEGKYHTDAYGGVPVGGHRVEITAHTAADFAEYRPGPFSVPPAQLLPKKYNVESTLQIEIPTGQRRMEHDFHLER